MKRIYILILICTSLHNLTGQPVSNYTTKHTNKFATAPKSRLSDYNSSLILAATIGTISGLLCRHIEKALLYDFKPFRLINIVMWGIGQDAIVSNILDDLRRNRVRHFPTLIKRGSWLISWLSYFGYDMYR